MSLFLSPIGNAAQFFDANGSPLNGGLITTYQAGSTTPQATYTTSSGVTQNANPIVLGVDGRTPNEIWFTSGVAYKFILTDSLSNVLGTFDNLSGINDTSSAPLTEWVASGLTPTYISATSFSVTGNQTLVFPVSQRVKTINTGGTAYSTVSTVTYNSGTGSTTIVVANDSTTLDSGLSAVSYGFTNPTYPSVGIAKTALSATTATNQSGGTVAATTVAASSSILSSSAAGGVGYATGAGNSVTQLTTINTAVTINAICGKIITVSNAFSAGGITGFTVNNTSVASGNTVIINCNSVYHNIRAVAVVNNSFFISFHTISNETASITINFAIIKAVIA